MKLPNWVTLKDTEIPNGTLAIVSGYINNNPTIGRWAEYAIYIAADNVWYPADYEETGSSDLFPPTHYILVPSTDTICDN